MSKKIMTGLSALILTGSLLGAVTSSLAADTDQVKFTIDKWNKPGSNNAGTADITITNGNDFAIKDVKISCNYMGNSAKMIETVQTVAVTVKAKTTKTFKKTKFPFIDTSTATGKCDLVSVAKG